MCLSLKPCLSGGETSAGGRGRLVPVKTPAIDRRKGGGQQKNKRRENRGEPINKQTKSRVRRDQTEKREEKSKGKGRRENSPRVLELLLSPSLSSSPGKVFLFSLFLHICCKRRKQFEGNLITFALCSAHVV
jgi:hypothetical protein